MGIEAQETLAISLTKSSSLTSIEDETEYAANPDPRGFAKVRLRVER